jgi:hypothetical protein
MKIKLFVAALIGLMCHGIAYSNPTIPILPYIFFEYNCSDIPGRYIHPYADNVKINDVIEANHSILNIIAKRLSEHPNATLTLTGTNSNSGSEFNNTKLSRDRAKSVLYLLIKCYNVNPSQIKLKVRNLPANPSDTSTKEGCEENRRVEIGCDDPSILAPVRP